MTPDMQLSDALCIALTQFLLNFYTETDKEHDIVYHDRIFLFVCLEKYPKGLERTFFLISLYNSLLSNALKKDSICDLWTE